MPRTAWSANSPWRPTPSSLIVLVLALMVFGLGESLIIASQLGASPWTVLSLGISRHLGFSVGMTTMLISVVVFVLWLPLKLKVGMGTIFNIIVIALAIDLFLPMLAVPATWAGKVVCCVAGTALIGIASGFYLTCQMGAGPRDGLMVGICRLTGLSVGVVRTTLEAGVCLLGYVLGGTVGVGTLIFAFGVGYALHYSLQALKNLG